MYAVVFMRLRQLDATKAISRRATSTIRFAALLYFSIWIGFPVLWLMLEFNLIGHALQLCMHAVLDVLCKSLYGFILLSFQLECEREEYIYLPLQPSIPVDDNVSETGDADVELGYTVTGGGLSPNFMPKGPVVGSSKQRKVTREIISAAREQEAEARLNGRNSPTYSPRGYTNSSTNPYANAGRDSSTMYTPNYSSAMYPPPSNMDESAILRQIHALNSQLNDMVDETGPR